MKGLGLLVAALAFVPAATASAQVFGTFTWQMQPHCNRVTLTLTIVPSGFTADGFDDQCGVGTRAGAAGMGVFNPDGSVGVNFTIVTSPGATAVQVATVLSPATGQGAWADSLGNSGTFALSGNTGGPPRPGPARALPIIDVADNPRLASDPCIGGVARETLVLCGTSTSQWNNGGFGLQGLQVWRDQAGLVHIRGSVRRTSANVGTDSIFVLPAGLRPKRTLGFTASTGFSAGAHQGGTALLVVYGDDVPGASGLVTTFSSSNATHTVVHLGEVMFSVDQ